MKKYILSILLLIGVLANAQTVPFKLIEKSSPIGTGSIVATNSLGVLSYTPTIPYTKISGISATSPLFYTSGTFSIQPSSTSQSGALSSTDWNTFNNKQAQLSGTGLVTATGTVISYDNTDYAVGPGTATGTNTGDETNASIGSIISSATTTAPDNTQYVPAIDASDNVVKMKWTDINSYIRTTYLDAAYQPLTSNLTSWAAITRASGFDAFTATPSSSNLASSLTNETGTDKVVFSDSPTLTGNATFSNTAYGGSLNEFKATNAASSSTLDLSTVIGNYIHVTGTVTINSFGVVQAGAERTLVFDGSLTLTSNTVSLILPGNSNIQTATNDVAVFRSEGSGNWRCVGYFTASYDYINYSPTLTGCSTDPPVSGSDARYQMITRNTCRFSISPSTTGTSNSTTKTITLPFNASSSGIQYIPLAGKDNNADTGMMLRTRKGSNIADIFKIFNTAHTSSGTWSYAISGTYQIDL